MDMDQVRRIFWLIAVILWVGILAIVLTAPEPQCMTDMECELLHGPGDMK
jgi:hypothetical protein